MSELPKGDYNLPPGVRACDIPGNRPEDNEDAPFGLCECCGEPKNDENQKVCRVCGFEEQ